MTLHVIGTQAFLRALSHAPPYLTLGISTLLAACAPRIMSADEIAECLYGDNQISVLLDPRNNIHVAVARLRKAGVPIRTHGNRGYSLDLPRRERPL